MKIGYSATFNYPNSLMPFEKHWVEEDELTHGLNLFEDITDEQLAQLTKNIRRIQYAIRKQVKDFQFESTKHDEKIAAENKEQVLDEDGRTIAEIMLCNSAEQLTKEFSLLSKKNNAIKAAYNNRLKQLQQLSNNGLEQY